MVTEIILGGLIFHPYSVPSNMQQTSLQSNIIVKDELNINYLVGHNSISQPIFGIAHDIKINDYMNFKYGGYLQDASEFEQRNISIPVGDFMPIIGLEFNNKIADNFGIVNVITPYLTFTGISYEF